jgi:hypothetical protein
MDEYYINLKRELIFTQTLSMNTSSLSSKKGVGGASSQGVSPAPIILTHE